MALSLLSKNGISENGISVPESVFTDLNLDQVLDRVCDGWDEDVRSLYAYVWPDLSLKQKIHIMASFILRKYLL